MYYSDKMLSIKDCHMKKIVILICIALFSTISLSAQGEIEKPTQQLKVGMMSAVDIVPFYYAQSAGYFAKEGVDVELILFSNGQNRQTALQTGQVDGSMTDIIALITSKNSGFPLIGTLSTDGVFPLLSRVDLTKEVSISAGVMEISVTNYLLDAYLKSTHQVKKVYINDIPTRLEAITSNKIDVGIFPEPFASIGALRGLEKVVYDSSQSESVDIIAFTEKAIAEKKSEIAAFHRAYAEAVKDLQEDPTKAEGVLFDSIPNLPPSIKGTISMPQYKRSRVPSEDFVKELITYTDNITKNIGSIPYSSIIDASFVK